MKKRVVIIAFLFFLVLFISSCQKEVVCAQDVKICPGSGVTVERVAPSCGFAPCPDVVCAQDVNTCPDGSFVKRIAPYCNFEDCPSNNTYMFISDSKVSRLCTSDDDCTLIRQKYGFSCCYTGICEIYDYAHKDFVPVNWADFNKVRDLNCPKQQDCGPTPLCSLRVVNADIKARCVGGICSKLQGYPESYYTGQQA